MGCGCGKKRSASAGGQRSERHASSGRERVSGSSDAGSIDAMNEAMHPIGTIRTNATMCALCRHGGDPTSAGSVCRKTGLPLTRHALTGGCPIGRHARLTIDGVGAERGVVRVVRWCGLDWYGVPMPLRWLALARLTRRRPRPGRVPVLSVAMGRVVLGLQRRGLWPKRLWWVRRIASTNPRMPGCGCVVVLKRLWTRAIGDAWGIGARP
jgi:hypothetical protein